MRRPPLHAASARQASTPVARRSARARRAAVRNRVLSITLAPIGSLAIILALVSGCDKARELLEAGQPAVPPQVSPEEALNLDADPVVLFQVFGERSAPRMIPIAAIRNGTLESIRLDGNGWQRFDQRFLRGGKQYALYHAGRNRGEVVVGQGMWEHDESLYSLPGCHTLTPIASVALRAEVRGGFTVELLASNGVLGAQRSVGTVNHAEAVAIAKRVAGEVGIGAGLSRPLLDSLDFHARAINTGGSAPTIIASFIDPHAEHARSSAVRTPHLFLIADPDRYGSYRATYTHAMYGALAHTEYRRFFDHLDLTGNGVDEIIVEGWQFGGDTFLAVLALSDGIWQEIFRTRSNWCLDERPNG